MNLFYSKQILLSIETHVKTQQPLAYSRKPTPSIQIHWQLAHMDKWHFFQYGKIAPCLPLNFPYALNLNTNKCLAISFSILFFLFPCGTKGTNKLSYF
jgi:hypothetical protein